MQKRIPLFVIMMIVVCLCTSAALASGPYGAPMSLLEHGQWAFDAGYAYETMNLFSCGSYIESYQLWEGEGWGETNYYGYDQCFRVMDFEMDAALASIEYGLCDNWDIYFRLGMAKAEGDIAWRAWGEREGIPFWLKESADFNWGFAWQIGTNFTFCQYGPWTWGGRMQFGMADPDSDSWTSRGSDESYVWRETCSADVDLYQAIAYIGPSYQPNDTWLLYTGLGWQCIRMNLDYTCYGTEYFEENGQEPFMKWYDDATGKLKHSSAIGVFGAAWMPHARAHVGADVLAGEDGKFGFSIVGQFPY